MAQSNEKYYTDIIDALLLETAKPVDDFSVEDSEYLANILSEYNHNTRHAAAAEFEFKILEEPQGKFNFRFKSQTKPKDGCLRGINSKRLLKTYPKVALQFRSHSNMIGEFFVRCTLHQFPGISGESSCLSPHLLWRRSDDCHVEVEFSPLHEEEPNLYSFTLKEFDILSTSRKDWLSVLMQKWRLLRKHNDCTEEEKEFERLANKQLCKPQDKVRLCFDVFQKDNYNNNNDNFMHIAGPFYSNCISNRQAPHITKICNTWGFKNEMTDITLLVSPVKPNDRIIISETKDVINGDEQNNNKSQESLWKTVISLQAQMLNDKGNIITFQMPIYGGRQDNLERIICKIRLERWSDGALSNDMNFEYVNKLKRRYNNTNMGLYENDSGAAEKRTLLEL